MEMERVKIELTVNGRKVCKYVAPAMRLADFLREELHLIGTKKDVMPENVVPVLY